MKLAILNDIEFCNVIRYDYFMREAILKTLKEYDIEVIYVENSGLCDFLVQRILRIINLFDREIKYEIFEDKTPLFTDKWLKVKLHEAFINREYMKVYEEWRNARTEALIDSADICLLNHASTFNNERRIKLYDRIISKGKKVVRVFT